MEAINIYDAIFLVLAVVFWIGFIATMIIILIVMWEGFKCVITGKELFYVEEDIYEIEYDDVEYDITAYEEEEIDRI